MKSVFCSIVQTTLLFFLCLNPLFADTASTSITVPLQRAYQAIETPRPIQIVKIPGDFKELLLVLQEGRVLQLKDDPYSSDVNVFLDITSMDLIENAFEEGLLGLVFHPDFTSNQLFYIYHTLQNPKRSVLIEKRVSGLQPLKVDKSYRREIISIAQPYWNHNSGIPAFGPDGYLYLSTGDGGNANDPHDHSQNTFSLLGKILRIDVDTRTGDLGYGIPPGNPFKNLPGYRQEVWAIGLRNPWRIHWDFTAGRLFCADVGQHLWEEVNLIQKGGNYGWNFREGTEEFPGKPDSNRTFPNINPIFQYGHEEGTSISGGCVYYGMNFPQLYGKYIFGDWGTGKCWALEIASDDKVSVKEISFEVDGEELNPVPKFIKGKPRSPFKPVNFCLGRNGRLFVLDWQGTVFSTI